MGNKHFAENPLLYIQQPTIATPVAPMQHNYYTPKQHHHSQNQTGEKSTRKIPLNRKRFAKYQPPIEESLEEEAIEEISEQIKFKDMTMREKVNYFINRPDHAPIIRCEIQTNEKKYHGVITGYEKDHVLIRVGRRSSSSEIPFQEIINIRILGF